MKYKKVRLKALVDLRRPRQEESKLEACMVRSGLKTEEKKADKSIMG